MSQLASPSYASIIANLIGSVQAPRMNLGVGGIAGSFANMTNQANQANASRGQNILRLLEGQGNTQLDDNNRALGEQNASIDQSMMNKGLANTTVGDNLKQGALNEKLRADASVRERSAANIAGMAERFTQQAPNVGLLAQLLENGGGGGGGRIVAGPNMNDPIFGLKPVGFGF